MTREGYISGLLKAYSMVELLSQKNGCKVLRLRNKALGKDLVLRSFPQPVVAYELLRNIRTDCLPEVYDVIEVEDGQIVLEEYISGITVEQVLVGGKYRYRGARKVLKAVCRALSVLHGRGLVHRDVKPSNVILDEHGAVVLIDLNASRKLSEASKDTVIMGTVGYVSPEQLGVSQTDSRTDIYAAGVMLNVMLTGEHPSVKLAHGRAGRIVKKCTSVNPNDRYQTAQKLSKAL